MGNPCLPMALPKAMITSSRSGLTTLVGFSSGASATY